VVSLQDKINCMNKSKSRRRRLVRRTDFNGLPEMSYFFGRAFPAHLVLLGATVCAALFSCNKQQGGPEGTDGGKIVYVESNDYHDNANAVLAYGKQPDGTLKPLPGSPFLTHGAGVANPQQVLGPDDSDDPIVISDDGHFLFAVNGGSNTVAVFSINPDGTLAPAPGSPFPSGGQTPCSVAIDGNFVYLANKSFDPLHTITQLPNYSTFTVDGSGRLEEVAGGKIEVPAGSSPSQVLLSNDKRFLFATDFLAFMLPPMEDGAPVGTLISFDVAGLGGLHFAPGAPYSVPAGDGGALGLATNPRSNTLYVGLPVAGAFGVYSIDPTDGVHREIVFEGCDQQRGLWHRFFAGWRDLVCGEPEYGYRFYHG
jgi:hypothetical protein